MTLKNTLKMFILREYIFKQEHTCQILTSYSKAEILSRCPHNSNFKYISLNHCKRHNIYKFCLKIPDNCLILTSKHIPKVRYRNHSKKCKLLLHCTESLERDDIEIFGL